MAIRAELSRPIKDDVGDISEKLQSFLGLSGPDGEPPRRVHGFSAFFLALCTVPAAERQHQILTICEMVALVSGLVLPIPVDRLRRDPTLQHGWTLQPSMEDATDALALFNFAGLLFSVFVSVALAMFVSAAGWKAPADFFEACAPLTGVVFATFMFSGLFPLLVLISWQQILVAGCPWPAIGAVVLFVAIFEVLLTMLGHFMLSEMPLELYHLPRWYMRFWRAILPHLASPLSDAALEPLARKRAEMLQARIGIEVLS